MERTIEQKLDEICTALDDGKADATVLRAHSEVLYAIGQTAWMLGGLEAMRKVISRAESETLNKRIGYVANQCWDGIGEWWA